MEPNGPPHCHLCEGARLKCQTSAEYLEGVNVPVHSVAKNDEVVLDAAARVDLRIA